MIKRTFGNFLGEVDPARDTFTITGFSYGWSATYSLEELPAKISWARRNVENPIHSDRGVNPGVMERYKQTLSCLRWGKRILEDG